MRVIVKFLKQKPRSDAPAFHLASVGGFVVGGLLLVWSAYIHFHLWDSVGYRMIATIGPLFLLQSIAGLLLGLLVIAHRRVWTAILGLGFSVSTMVGFFISVHVGLFGFQDSSNAPFAHLALIIEIAIAVVLLAAGALCLTRSAPSTTTAATPAQVPSTGA
jgi:hypothetical protein